jgi:transcriptional regulator with XRE-family HTH domain|tara:strand:+ start:1892 stop:2254 length:363 start_codon:yes stop_codon:yes gene_type:complete
MSEGDSVAGDGIKRRSVNNAYCVENLGARVREMRMAKKLSQRALASEARVPASTIARLETGDLGGLYTNSLASIAYILNCTSDYLLFGNSRKGSKPTSANYDISAETRDSEVVIRIKPKE